MVEVASGDNVRHNRGWYERELFTLGARHNLTLREMVLEFWPCATPYEEGLLKPWDQRSGKEVRALLRYWQKKYQEGPFAGDLSIRQRIKQKMKARYGSGN
jgi:hypothetical protein